VPGLNHLQHFLCYWFNTLEDKFTEIYCELVGGDLLVKDNPGETRVLDISQDTLPDQLRRDIITNFFVSNPFPYDVQNCITICFYKFVCFTFVIICVVPDF